MLSAIGKEYCFWQRNLFKKQIAKIVVIFTAIVTSTAVNAVELGEQAIDFKLKTLAGEEFNLADYKGNKPVYLIFWASWCPICKAEVPKFKELYSKFGDRVEFLAINVGFQDTLEKTIDYTKTQQLPYKVAFDKDTIITKEYDVIGTPWQVIIDINGLVRYFSNYTPEISENDIDALFEETH